jgi:hypothetical protein
LAGFRKSFFLSHNVKVHVAMYPLN